MSAFHQVKDGEFTSTIYGCIKDGRYGDAAQILSHQLQMNSNSRAALSLLGYCYYHQQDFNSAADCYEQLVNLYPDNDDYRY